MNSLRSRYCSALLFVMISIGQGYSFGLLWNLKGQGIVSNEILKLLSTEKTPDTPPSKDLICNSQWQHQIQSNPYPSRPQKDAFGFQFEPFLLSRIEPQYPSPLLFSVFIRELDLKNLKLSPDSPPPKSLI